MRRLAPLLALFALAAALRLFGIGHGFPRTEYVPDTHVVRGALGMAADKNPFPPVGRWSTYPNLVPYVLLPVYATQYAVGRVSGAWSGAGEYGQKLQLEPARAHGPARVTIALIGAGLVIAAYAAVRAAGRGGAAGARDDVDSQRHEVARSADGRTRALLAAYLAATCLLSVHFSMQERPWAVVATLGLLACWPAALYTTSGRLVHLVWCAACAALACAAHQAGLPLLGIAGLAWLFGPAPLTALRTRLVHGVVAVGVFALVALLVGYNAYLVHGAPERAAVAGASLVEGDASVGDLELGGQAILFDLRLASFVRLSRALVGYDLAIVVLAAIGLVAALRSRAARVPTVFGLAWLAFFTTNQNDHVRYLLPGVVFLIVPAAYGAQMLVARGGVWRVALGLVLALPLVQASRLSWLLAQDDTRALAEERLAAQPIEGVLAVDRYGPVFAHNASSLARIATWRELGGRESLAREALAAGLITNGAVDAVPLGDLFLFDERHRAWDFATGLPEALQSATSADDLLDRLGVTHVLVVDRDTSDARAPLLVDTAPPLAFERGPRAGEFPSKLAPLDLVHEPLWEIGAPRAEQRLPTELDFPLTQLWRVERPGPHLALYERTRDGR
jgi:hypothetical protein